MLRFCCFALGSQLFFFPEVVQHHWRPYSNVRAREASSSEQAGGWLRAQSSSECVLNVTAAPSGLAWPRSTYDITPGQDDTLPDKWHGIVLGNEAGVTEAWASVRWSRRIPEVEMENSKFGGV